MGKSKGRGKPVKTKGGGGGGGGTQAMKGTHKAFKVPKLKVKTKHKTKAVITNLKRLNVQNRQQVNQSDNAFTQLQKDMKTTAVHSKKSKPIALANTSKKPDTKKDNEPNMEEATEQMACL